MPAWTPQFLASLVTSLVVSAFTAVLTVQLSLRRFQAERWWERKVDAYTRIIEALHHVNSYKSMGYESWLESREFSPEYEAEIKSSHTKAQSDLRLATEVGAYIISDDVAKILAELASRPSQFKNVENPLEAIQSDLDAYQKALAKIRELAKRDLKVR
jgi:ABC-type multidrug transport system fused ATPase/permease subunit